MKGSMADLPRVWRPLNRPDFGVIDSISETIRQEEWKDPDLLIGIDRGREVILVSDYAGDSRESSFQSYSFLLIDLLFIWYWDAVRMHLRKNFLPDRRRLSLGGHLNPAIEGHLKSGQRGTHRSLATAPWLPGQAGVGSAGCNAKKNKGNREKDVDLSDRWVR